MASSSTRCRLVTALTFAVGTAYAKTALETYMAEMGKMSEVVSASVKDSMKPLNERMTAMVERMQAAR